MSSSIVPGRRGRTRSTTNSEPDPRPSAGCALQLDLPSQTFYPLAHSREAHARSHRRGIEFPTVVRDLRHHQHFLPLLVLRSQPHLDVEHLGVAPSVGGGLLKYAQELNALLLGRTGTEAGPPLVWPPEKTTPVMASVWCNEECRGAARERREERRI